MMTHSMLNRRISTLRPALILAEVFLAMVVLTTVALLSPARAAEAPLDTAMQAVLTVHSADNADRFLGSAFLWGAEAEVAVTNAHVVGDAEEVRLTDHLGRQEIGVVIARDVVRDVAVIAVAPGRTGLVPAAVPGLGAEVWALGAPLGIEFTVTQGMISASARQVDVAVPIRMVQHDAAVNPGSSGGPLVDATGRLVGMNSQIADGSRMFVGIAYAISADDLVRIVTGLIEETLPAFPQFGMRVRPVDRQIAAALGVSARGLLVDAVEPGGLAAASGLQAGDILQAVDGVALEHPGGFAFSVEGAQRNGRTEIAIWRGGADLVLTVALEQAAPGQILRLVGEGAAQRQSSYTLAALGLKLGEDAVVRHVTTNSPALLAGLSEGDRLLAVNGRAMDATALQALAIDAPAMVLVLGESGATRHVFIDPWADAAGIRPVGGANVLDPDVVVF